MNPNSDLPTPRPYKSPLAPSVLNALAALTLIAAAVLLWYREYTSGLVTGAVAVTTVIWAQMLDQIARAAHYAQVSAEALVRAFPPADGSKPGTPRS